MPEVNPLFPPLAVIVTGVVDDCGVGPGRSLPDGLGANCELAGKNGGRVIELFDVISCEQPGAEGVVIAQGVRRIRLKSVGEITVFHLRRVAIKKQVLRRVRA